MYNELPSIHAGSVRPPAYTLPASPHREYAVASNGQLTGLAGCSFASDTLWILLPAFEAVRDLWILIGDKSLQQWWQSVNNVREDVNTHNAPDGPAPQYGNGICHDYWIIGYTGDGCFSCGEVDAILTCYQNLVIKGKHPPYYYAVAANPAVWGPLVTDINACVGDTTPGRIREVLESMRSLSYKANNGQPMVHIAMIDPKGYEQLKVYNSTNGVQSSTIGWFQSFKDSLVSGLETTADILKWAAILIGVGALAYFGWQFYQGTK